MVQLAAAIEVMAMQGGAASVAADPGVASASVGLTPDLKKRIEIMAEHVSKNGTDFESTVRLKSGGNPSFGFLFDGEGSRYYAALVKALRSAVSVQLSSPGSAGGAANNAELTRLVRKWQEPMVAALKPEQERQLTEIVASLEKIASRDAISKGRQWFEHNAPYAPSIGGHLMKRIVFLPTCAHRLHVLFLVHDVLQTEMANKEAGGRLLLVGLKPFLIWMLRPSFQLAQSTSPDGDETVKILKLLSLWTDLGAITVREAEEMRQLTTARELPANTPQPGVPASALAMLAGPPVLGSSGYDVQDELRRATFEVQSMQQRAAALGTMARGTAGPLSGLPSGFRPGPLPAPQTNFTVFGPGSQTPETIPVGLMASMLKQVSQRGKDLHTAFVPYKPLDPLYTPQNVPPQGPPTESLLQRLRMYYENIGENADEKLRPFQDVGNAVGAALPQILALAAPPPVLALTAPPVVSAGGFSQVAPPRSRSRSRSRSPRAKAAAAAIALTS